MHVRGRLISLLQAVESSVDDWARHRSRRGTDGSIVGYVDKATDRITEGQFSRPSCRLSGCQFVLPRDYSVPRECYYSRVHP
jgi:hypothetical protein